MPKPRPPDLAALSRHLASDAERDPRATLAVAEKLREIAATVERAAIRAALERERWFEAPAAASLGIPRQSMQRKMGEELLAEARQRREGLGYTKGPRPKEE